MSETALWLLFCLSSLVAFAAVYYRRWYITVATLAGGLVIALGWAILYWLSSEEKRPDWVRIDLSINLSLGVIFAAAGAALAHFLLMRNRSP